MALIKNSLFIQLFVALADTLPVGAKLVLQITAGAADRTHHSPATVFPRDRRLSDPAICAHGGPVRLPQASTPTSTSATPTTTGFGSCSFACAVAHYMSRCVTVRAARTLRELAWLTACRFFCV